MTAPREAILEPPVVVVSPHLDDGVLGCANLIAAHPGTVVVTVFGGHPSAAGNGVTPWDAAGGFGVGDDPVTARRAEDVEALAVLGAAPRWLDFTDHQYRSAEAEAEADVEEIADALEAVVQGTGARTVLGPLGLGHPDHVACAAAVGALVARHRSIAWLVYEDALYRASATEQERASAARALADRGLTLDPCCPPLEVSTARKRAAIACYPSQVRALMRFGVRALNEAEAPEQYWRIRSESLRGLDA